jgi:hypothetical protein
MTHLCKILPDLFPYRNPLHCSHDHTVRMDNMKNMITLAMVEQVPVPANASPAHHRQLASPLSLSAQRNSDRLRKLTPAFRSDLRHHIPDLTQYAEYTDIIIRII